MRAELSIEIARPPEDVFAYLSDVSNLTDWQAGVCAAAIVGGGESRAGARIEESRSLLGRELHTTLEIVEHEPPRLFVLRSLDGPVRFTVRHELEPDGAGGTLLGVSGEVDTGLVPGFAVGLMRRRAERQFRGDFERLKQRLES